MALNVGLDVLLKGRLAAMKEGMQKRESMVKKTKITKRAKALARGGEVTQVLRNVAAYQLKREGKI